MLSAVCVDVGKGKSKSRRKEREEKKGGGSAAWPQESCMERESHKAPFSWELQEMTQGIGY